LVPGLEPILLSSSSLPDALNRILKNKYQSLLILYCANLRETAELQLRRIFVSGFRATISKKPLTASL